jgi:NAD(P)-dependent dehydrogenase (short-subunit alcohol dehydrogenase family)
MNERRLDGKVAIITGSASGIGRATAVLFAQQGARIVVNTDKRVAEGEETVARVQAVGGEAVFVQGDVAIGDDVQELVTMAETHFGRLDIFVNNAAIVQPNKIVDVPESDWDRTMAVILKAVYWSARYAIPAFMRAGSGSMVNISTVNSGIVANPSWPAYTAAKGGVNALTRQLAVDYGPYGIRFNVICPASIANERLVQHLADDPLEARYRTDAYPLGKIGRPIDVAYAALFLASDEAAFISGATMLVDGGLTSQTPESLVLPAARQRAGKEPLHFADDPAGFE